MCCTLTAEIPHTFTSVMDTPFQLFVGSKLESIFQTVKGSAPAGLNHHSSVLLRPVCVQSVKTSAHNN